MLSVLSFRHEALKCPMLSEDVFRPRDHAFSDFVFIPRDHTFSNAALRLVTWSHLVLSPRVLRYVTLRRLASVMMCLVFRSRDVMFCSVPPVGLAINRIMNI